jgi:hypothetical protein
MTVTLADRLGDRGAHNGALYNGDAEQRVLGAILCDKKNFHRVTELLRPEHFGNAVHSRIFTAAAHLIAVGKTANPVTLKDLFDQDDALTTIGGARYLAQLAAAGALVDVEDYALIILDLACRRALIAAAQDAIDLANRVDLKCTAADITARLENSLVDLKRDGPNRLGGIDPRSLGGLPVPPRRFIVTPWIPMRRATGLYGIGGIGKTTLMQMLCTSAALDPVKFPKANWLGLPVLRCPSSRDLAVRFSIAVVALVGAVHPDVLNGGSS